MIFTRISLKPYKGESVPTLLSEIVACAHNLPRLYLLVDITKN